MADLWEVHALKYAERNDRTRAESFLYDENPTETHHMDYFLWVLQNGDDVIVVDTGYDTEEAARRERPILRDPAKALEALGVDAATVPTVILTHLHYDHAGALHRFPAATFHVQEAEMAFVTGPCMCHPYLQFAFTADHVCQMVHNLYSGRVFFHAGSGQVRPGVRVHRVGGHSRGLQIVEVDTPNGPLILASDAAHYFENYLKEVPFPLVVDIEDAVNAFRSLIRLGGTPDRIIPGHDPIVAKHFHPHPQIDFAWRLDLGPKTPLP